MNAKKQIDERVNLYSGALVLLSLIFGSASAFGAIVDSSLARKIILEFIFIVLLVALRQVYPLRKRKKAFRKKLSDVVDLFLAVQIKVHPDFKKILIKALFLRMLDMALRAAIVIVLLAAIENFAETKLDKLLNPAPTPTLTLSPTLIPSVTASQTPRSEADYGYYMVVVDASVNMKNSFHGYSVWDAAIKTTNEILRVLPQKSHYGLVAIGGADVPDKSTLCEEPSSIRMPFSPQSAVWENIAHLTPTGGGSFLSAFLTARDQLLDLEPTMSKAMVFVTGANDTCEGEDEWAGLKKALEVTDTMKVYNQIVILDEDGDKSQDIADRINSVSGNVNAQAPQTVEDIQAGGTTVVNVVNNVKYYVNNYYTTNVPQPPTTIPSATVTLKPGETPLPTSTFTDIPTLAPTSTRTFTPIPASPTVLVCPPVSHPVLVGQGLGGSADIYSPAPCTIGLTPETAIYSNGVYSNIPDGTYVWELVYASDHLYYPQSPNACGGGAPPIQDGPPSGNWSVDTYLGSAADMESKWYDIIVAVADEEANNQLTNWLVSHCPSFPGIGYETLSQWNITEKVSITVRTR